MPTKPPSRPPRPIALIGDARPALPPHPATVAPRALPPHPATVAQARSEWRGLRQRPPHAATLPNRRDDHGATNRWPVQRAAAKDDNDAKRVVDMAFEPTLPEFPEYFSVLCTEALAGFVQNFATFAYCRVAWSEESYGNGAYSYLPSIHTKNTAAQAGAAGGAAAAAGGAAAAAAVAVPARHAEINLIAAIKARFVKGLVDEGAQHVVLFILLNNSPCPDCTRALEAFCGELEDELGNAKVECVVHAASYYHAAKDPDQKRYAKLNHLSVEVHPLAVANEDAMMSAAANAAIAKVASGQMTEAQAATWMDQKVELILKKIGYKV